MIWNLCEFHMIVNMNFALDIGPNFCCHLIFSQSRHSAKAREKEKPGLIDSCQMSLIIVSPRFEIGNHSSRKFFAFCPQFASQQGRHASKTVRSESHLFL
jgi:hypothetical protein